MKLGLPSGLTALTFAAPSCSEAPSPPSTRNVNRWASDDVIERPWYFQTGRVHPLTPLSELHARG